MAAAAVVVAVVAGLGGLAPTAQNTWCVVKTALQNFSPSVCHPPFSPMCKSALNSFSSNSGPKKNFTKLIYIFFC